MHGGPLIKGVYSWHLPHLHLFITGSRAMRSGCTAILSTVNLKATVCLAVMSLCWKLGSLPGLLLCIMV
nr:MAG TPA: hypothetical protein [Caudoviricetes sp.]